MLLVASGFALLTGAALHASRVAALGQMEIRADALALGLSRTLDGYRRALLGIAEDPGVRALLQEGDAEGIAARERELATLLRDVARVRLLRAGQDRVQAAADTPLSYVPLMLLRAAKDSRDPPPLELYQAGGGKPYVGGAAAVRASDGGLLGQVFVAFDGEFVQRALRQDWPAGARVEVRQRVEGAAVTFMVSPGAPDAAGDPNGSRDLKASQLILAHWFRPSLWESEGVLLLAAVVGGTVLVLVALLLSLQQRRLRKALLADQAAWIQAADDVLAGRKPRNTGARVSEFAAGLELFMQRLVELRAAPPPAGAKRTGAVPSSAPAAGFSSSEIEVETEPVDGGPLQLPASIFRAYDIRGVVGETLNPEIVYELGRGVGTLAYEAGQQAVIVARDARPSSPELSDALIAGVNAAGRDVVDLGLVPVPVLYFACHALASNAGAMVTGSHNAPEYNGLKIVIGAESLSPDALQGLRARIDQGDVLEGTGSVQARDLIPDYIERVAEDVSIARVLRIVVDCAHGSTSLVAPELYRTLGCDVVELYCDLEANASDHHADPSRPENLRALQQAVLREQADLGLAFDGDGDRLGVVDSAGNVIWPDRVLMLLAADVLARHPGGDVLFDVKCSRALASHILQNGGRPVMWKSGHSLLKAKLRETGALLAGEWSGHIMFRERWYGFDDAMYSGARLLEILSLEPASPAEVFADLPQLVATPELLLEVEDGRQGDLLARLQARENLFQGAKITRVDGLRAEFEDGWGLIRESNTTPALSFRFEADSEPALARIQALFRDTLNEIAPDLRLPF
jgi:phosphomannomutase/phosphoglucomutase